MSIGLCHYLLKAHDGLLIVIRIKFQFLTKVYLVSPVPLSPSLAMLLTHRSYLEQVFFFACSLSSAQITLPTLSHMAGSLPLFRYRLNIISSKRPPLTIQPKVGLYPPYSTPGLPIILLCNGVLFCWGCHNKISQTG